MARFLGPRRLDDDLPEPQWLRDNRDAANALQKLVSMGRVQNRLLSALQLLRTEVLTNAKQGTVKGHPRVPWFPSRDEVDQAAKALAKAADTLTLLRDPRPRPTQRATWTRWLAAGLTALAANALLVWWLIST